MNLRHISTKTGCISPHVKHNVSFIQSDFLRTGALPLFALGAAAGAAFFEAAELNLFALMRSSMFVLKSTVIVMMMIVMIMVMIIMIMTQLNICKCN